MPVLEHDFNKDQIMTLVWAVLASGHDLGKDCPGYIVKCFALTLWNKWIDFFLFF